MENRQWKLDRLGWMKIHGYMSVFFLPLAVIYTITGILYMFALHGGDIETRIPVPESTAWPATPEQAQAIMTEHIVGQDIAAPDRLPRERFGSYLWGGFHTSVSLERDRASGAAALVLRENDLWKKLILVHKGIAGPVFMWLGVALGVSFMVSLISGTILIYKSPMLKKTANVLLILGSLTCVIAYYITP